MAWARFAPTTPSAGASHVRIAPRYGELLGQGVRCREQERRRKRGRLRQVQRERPEERLTEEAAPEQGSAEQRQWGHDEQPDDGQDRDASGPETEADARRGGAAIAEHERQDDQPDERLGEAPEGGRGEEIGALGPGRVGQGLAEGPPRQDRRDRQDRCQDGSRPAAPSRGHEGDRQAEREQKAAADGRMRRSRARRRSGRH